MQRCDIRHIAIGSKSNGWAHDGWSVRGRDDDIPDIMKQHGKRKTAHPSSVDHSPTRTATVPTHNTTAMTRKVGAKTAQDIPCATEWWGGTESYAQQCHWAAERARDKRSPLSALSFAPSRVPQTSCRQEDDTRAVPNGEMGGKKEDTQCRWRARHARKKWWSRTRGETNTWGDMMMRPPAAHPRVLYYIHTSEGLEGSSRRVLLDPIPHARKCQLCQHEIRYGT